MNVFVKIGIMYEKMNFFFLKKNWIQIQLKFMCVSIYINNFFNMNSVKHVFSTMHTSQSNLKKLKISKQCYAYKMDQF